MPECSADDFLLSTPLAKELFHETAAACPVIDYHNHLAPAQLCTQNPAQNLTQLWIASDPYKHRAMRMNGIAEELITGHADDKAKFMAWARTRPRTLGGPLYDWSYMELAAAFGIADRLDESSAEVIWQTCNEQLSGGLFSSAGFLKKCHVECVCPCAEITDDPTAFSAAEGIDVLPSLRGDSLLAFDKQTSDTGYTALTTLARLSGGTIRDLSAYKNAIRQRLDIFDACGCLLSDHSLDDGFSFSFAESTSKAEEEAASLFQRVLRREPLSEPEVQRLQTELLLFLAKEYAARGWVLQLHLGAQRFTSSRLRSLCGPAGGYAAAGQTVSIRQLTTFFDCLERSGTLPKTILYTLDPTQMPGLAILSGSFSEDNTAGKIQLGPAWWLCDHYAGITSHLDIVANYSMLGAFIGMTTDSRNVLSFSRHSYFRRILCRMLGEWVATGRIPDDGPLLHTLVHDICIGNIKRYLKR